MPRYLNNRRTDNLSGIGGVPWGDVQKRSWGAEEAGMSERNERAY